MPIWQLFIFGWNNPKSECQVGKCQWSNDRHETKRWYFEQNHWILQKMSSFTLWWFPIEFDDSGKFSKSSAVHFWLPKLQESPERILSSRFCLPINVGKDSISDWVGNKCNFLSLWIVINRIYPRSCFNSRASIFKVVGGRPFPWWLPFPISTTIPQYSKAILTSSPSRRFVKLANIRHHLAKSSLLHHVEMHASQIETMGAWAVLF